MAVIATVAAVIIILVILVMRKRIALVVQLFKEAGKALQSMPLLMFQPIWVSIFSSFILVANWSALNIHFVQTFLQKFSDFHLPCYRRRRLGFL